MTYKPLFLLAARLLPMQIKRTRIFRFSFMRLCSAVAYERRAKSYRFRPLSYRHLRGGFGNLLIATTLCGALTIIPAHAQDWTQSDMARETAWGILWIADWGQTLDISARPREYREQNPMLGSHPGRGTVNAYFLSGLLLHPIIAHIAGRYRRHWQYVTIGVELGYVANNARIGLRMRF